MKVRKEISNQSFVSFTKASSDFIKVKLQDSRIKINIFLSTQPCELNEQKGIYTFFSASDRLDSLQSIVGKFSDPIDDKKLSLYDLVSGREEINSDNIDCLIGQLLMILAPTKGLPPVRLRMKSLINETLKELNSVSRYLKVIEYSDNEKDTDSDSEDEEMIAELRNIQNGTTSPNR